MLVWDALYLYQREGSLRARPKTLLASHRGGVGFKSPDATPTLAVLLTASAIMSIHGSIDAADQLMPSERLCQKANGSCLQRPGAEALFGKSRDKDKRRGVPLGAQMGQKVQAAHRGHLHICNDTRRVV